MGVIHLGRSERFMMGAGAKAGNRNAGPLARPVGGGAFAAQSSRDAAVAGAMVCTGGLLSFPFLSANELRFALANARAAAEIEQAARLRSV